MEVNSATRVTNLNADRLDGRHAGAFLPTRTYRKFEGTAGSELPDGSRLANISCDDGDVLLSGGFQGVNADTSIVGSQPVDFVEGWELVWINGSSIDSVIVSVYCADFGSPHTP